MKKSLVVLALLSALSFPALAQGQSPTAPTQVAITIQVVSPPSTNISCVVNYPQGTTAFIAPVAVNTNIATCTVVPAAWQGTLVLTGTSAASFGVNGLNIINPAALQVGNYSLTVTP